MVHHNFVEYLCFKKYDKLRKLWYELLGIGKSFSEKILSKYNHGSRKIVDSLFNFIIAECSIVFLHFIMFYFWTSKQKKIGQNHGT